jgi:hypothetical protein
MEIKMNKTFATVLIIVAIVVLAVGAFFAGAVYSRSNMMFGWNGNAYSYNMMNGNSGITNMMSGNGGMMNGNASSMMRGYNNNNAKTTPLTVDQAKAAAEKYLVNLNNSDFKIAEVMIFDNNAYVVVKESSTGLGAFELLVDSNTQAAYPEHGPNMMWNLKYGGLNHQYMMGNSNGMMGGNGGMAGMMYGNGGMANMMGGNGWNSTAPADVSATMTVTAEQAIQYAQKYLDANISGATAATDPTQFYGYFTLDFEKDGKVAGMLSVNGYSGQVFLHTWHGTFVEESEIK